jgi:hypothetical protein
LLSDVDVMQARLGEKETLDVTLRYFEDRRSKLDQLEYYQERRLKGLGLLDDDGNNTWDDFFKDSIAWQHHQKYEQQSLHITDAALLRAQSRQLLCKLIASMMAFSALERFEHLNCLPPLLLLNFQCSACRPFSAQGQLDPDY